jgi:hypothetical protein
MDSSVLTEQKRNKTLYSFYVHNPTKEYLISHEDVLNRKKGAMTLYENNRAVDDGCGCIEENHYSIDEALFYSLERLLEYCAISNQGPTKSSRIFYIWFTSIVSGFNWIESSGPLNTTIDNFDFSIRYPLPTFDEKFVFMNRVFNSVCTTMIPGFSEYTLLEEERKALEISIAEQVLLENKIKSKGHFDDWNIAWNTWYINRSNDGSVLAAVPPMPCDLPNGPISLDVSDTIDPATYPQPLKWTPLKIGSNTQKYLTFTWENVNSSGLTAPQTTTIKNSAIIFYPSLGAREAEIDEVVTITNTLTDEQKVIAEFWAGGPFTVSPPGMFIYFWKEYNRVRNTAHTISLQHLFYSGLDLAIHLFEAGRLVWGLKYTYLQARPIQEIRRLYRGITLTNYDGTPVLGESWVPYQETNFVTPPFADFPSGHSAYSRGFANVMNDWFGSSIGNYEIKYKNLKLISPLFDGDQTNKFGQFKIGKGSSLIQPSVVPSDDITLNFENWDDMAMSAGISRKYGGIHATSAHTASVALANELHTQLKLVWNLV